MSQNSSFLNKPETALRRAEELVSIQQPNASLALLHEVLSSRRHKTWSPTYEKIILLYLDLCLALNRPREAKDGLHQYRNLSQSQAPGSLESVIKQLMEKAETKCKEARDAVERGESLVVPPTVAGEGDRLVENPEDDADDEAFYDTPQSILLSTMSADPEKAQRDTALLLPALKFLWEVYRAVLDILKSNSKLERLYHGVAVNALKFCGEYKRRVEFRRLSDMMRMHLGNLQKYGLMSRFEEGKSSNKVRGWEGWTAESIELHLQTRFVQLETASSLRLYTEGFRTVEDIYNILQISRARRKIPGVNIPPPKAKIMAAYYEKLTNLFWVSENYLFHAFAWYKYYSLCKEYNRGMSAETRQMQASAVLLAALSIPKNTSDIRKNKPATGDRLAIQSTVEDDIAKEKMARMATLLGFHTREPSREAILAEIRAKNIMDDVPQYLRELYVILEATTDPLDMVEKARPLLDTLRRETGVLADGVAASGDVDDAAEDTALGRYVKPLTNVLLLKLIFNISAAYHTISLDHVKKLTSGLGVSFEQMEKSIVLSSQSRALSVRIDHRAGCIRFGSAALERRAALYADVRSTLESEHIATLERKVVIEKRKEEAERIIQEKLREEERQRKQEEMARKAEEERRLARESKMREKEKIQKIQDEMDALEKKRYLTAMGRSVENMTAEELKEVDTAALAKEHAEKANKKKEEAERKIKEAARQLDHLVRAVRIEELPRIKASYEAKIKEDRENYEREVVEKAKQAKEQWTLDVKEKKELIECSVFDYSSVFESRIMAARKIVHEKLCKQEDERAELEAENGKLARARKRKEDEKRRLIEEEERRIREEEERKEEEERLRREEQKRLREQELEKKELARMNELREREARERQERAQPPLSSGLGDTSATSEGKYVPPARRGGGASMGGGTGGASRWGSDRGGGYGGGRYEGRDSGRDRVNDRDRDRNRVSHLSLQSAIPTW
ncbi:hypothetical protein HJC23_006909 [Cyclotella cryptica]|uniref:Eukaryotic translation initiation factor 3 subunit A n=1 Tax=Cyclotella cryptica TaxID=29204 RepID=A0ABD3QEE5_9STRA